MTEQEWLNCTDPTRMLDFLSFRCKANATAKERDERKLRLFSVACCYGVWDWMPDQRSRMGVETAEKQADGLVSEQELQVARNEAGEVNDFFVGKATYLSESARAAWYALNDPYFMWVSDVVRSAVRFSVSDQVDGYRFSLDTDSEEVRAATLRENARQLGLLRDIYGDPFYPAQVDPVWLAWQGGTIPDLAQTIYDCRAFDRLPMLADALDDAGCTSLDFQVHCREPGPHVRGCWVLDLLLNKKSDQPGTRRHQQI
jgi:hypothetical protein